MYEFSMHHTREETRNWKHVRLQVVIRDEICSILGARLGNRMVPNSKMA